ncbi:lysozyme [Erwinia sp. OLTSP20]|uniref:type VI secretion system baseplate subunit TssE n=1 Tax=unclassified Erwinia TaxID=2622719 RepID=UPI000C18493B|nr:MULTISPECIES: GPW/gp25 family protein [unclassified Erwinia]PIJ48301.1 lysozyme [Erwinia sp. OAMSP11]PIJ71620.1 lysozyme [Erwinia sp. OLSSP12]PIJ82690.1 lysozyme [Erwinia sp. OLCASP19]PIJ83157.1 lysozyme [Erwinia sp. OLMTSP26]PIJ85323.1 lysozyme [Erwinia sp. OLMDSP33]
MTLRRNPFPPCLLERLFDNEPKVESEVWDKYHFDSRAMRAVVQRNIAELLNTANFEERLDENRHREIFSSTLNYGISPLIGGYAASHSWNDLEIKIRNALLRFEPRLIADSIVIVPSGEVLSPVHHGIINFDIYGLIDWHPQPVDLAIKARYDIETDRAGLS